LTAPVQPLEQDLGGVVSIRINAAVITTYAKIVVVTSEMLANVFNHGFPTFYPEIAQALSKFI
jgi:hypothetical protein